jgi:tetratricopeptide (TPR) repeat protein
MLKSGLLCLTILAMLIVGCTAFTMRGSIPKDKILQKNAQKAYDRGNYTSAVDYLNQAIAIDPEYSPYHRARSEAYRQMGMIEQAEKDYNRYEQLRNSSAYGSPGESKQFGSAFGVVAYSQESKPEVIHNEAAEKKWSVWQEQMQSAFQLLESKELSGSQNKEQIAGAWEDFLNRFSNENPYTHEDNELRVAAINKIAGWRNSEMPAGPASPATYDSQPHKNQSRTALVIGNSSYQHIVPLKNPSNDAKAISLALSQYGFNVETVIDADRRDMFLPSGASTKN